MKKKLIISTIVIAIVFSGAYFVFGKEITKQKFGGVGPQVLNWKKPTTDAQWAEDVKAENFDIKSTSKLQEMITSHTSKLAREEKDFQKFVDMQKAGDDPVEFLYWQKRDELKQSYPTMNDKDLDIEAQNAAQSEYNQKLREIEKIKQSLERMDKEVELRQKGFVLVEGESPAVTVLGSTKGKIIRQIHD